MDDIFVLGISTTASDLVQKDTVNRPWGKDVLMKMILRYSLPSAPTYFMKHLKLKSKWKWKM